MRSSESLSPFVEEPCEGRSVLEQNKNVSLGFPEDLVRHDLAIPGGGAIEDVGNLLFNIALRWT